MARELLGVNSEALLRAKATQQARATGVTVVESATPIYAYINHGRWVAMCQCGAGVACDPTFSIAVCFLHRDLDDTRFRLETRIHTAVVWPPNSALIETLLEERISLRDQSWDLGETPDDLIAQNTTLGLKAVRR